jgi:ribosome-associated protein
MKSKDIEKSKDVAKRIANIIKDEKGEDIVVLNLVEISTALDLFVIATGISKTHLRGIAEQVQITMKSENVLPLHIEGYNEANWILMDYGNIIIHLFDQKNRNFYQLERLWGDAKEIAF